MVLSLLALLVQKVLSVLACHSMRVSLLATSKASKLSLLACHSTVSLIYSVQKVLSLLACHSMRVRACLKPYMTRIQYTFLERILPLYEDACRPL
jgi:hypothetical protein